MISEHTSMLFIGGKSEYYLLNCARVSFCQSSYVPISFPSFAEYINLSEVNRMQKYTWLYRGVVQRIKRSIQSRLITIKQFKLIIKKADIKAVDTKKGTIMGCLLKAPGGTTIVETRDVELSF